MFDMLVQTVRAQMTYSKECGVFVYAADVGLRRFMLPLFVKRS